MPSLPTRIVIRGGCTGSRCMLQSARMHAQLRGIYVGEGTDIELFEFPPRQSRSHSRPFYWPHSSSAPWRSSQYPRVDRPEEVSQRSSHLSSKTRSQRRPIARMTKSHLCAMDHDPEYRCQSGFMFPCSPQRLYLNSNIERTI